MTWLATAWDWAKRVPTALWAAVFAAATILLLYLRGRRLEGELAKSKLKEQASKAYALTAKHEGAREVHEKAAELAAAESKELEKERLVIAERGEHERERIKSLPGHEVHKEYVELARRARERARGR
jgi:hypothetical protein